MKVNDYVRTEAGDIGKIISEGIVDFLNKRHIYRNFNELKKDKDIIKSSPNIIDLIEVGDYVNGERIQFITNKKELLTNGGYDILKKYKNIKSIVTKEQFESMEYKVGD